MFFKIVNPETGVDEHVVKPWEPVIDEIPTSGRPWTVRRLNTHVDGAIEYAAYRYQGVLRVRRFASQASAQNAADKLNRSENNE